MSARVLSHPAPGFRLSDKYGPRKGIDVDGDGKSDTSSIHGGQDFAPYRGGSRAIVAGAEGVVVPHPYSSSAGIAVCIYHEPLRLWTGSAHLSQALVRVGDRVRRGQQIGVSGATGTAKGEHLHYDVFTDLSDFIRIDPLPLIDLDGKAVARPDIDDPTTTQEPTMKLIQEASRGIAVVGPGYYHSLTPEELPYAIKLYGFPTVYGNPREFDLARAIHTNPSK